uniref:Secreted protein n=1 Tax=Triticum urartu TaxID=4572 RepID=A0A8R7PLE6_TRIUA
MTLKARLVSCSSMILVLTSFRLMQKISSCSVTSSSLHRSSLDKAKAKQRSFGSFPSLLSGCNRCLRHPQILSRVTSDEKPRSACLTDWAVWMYKTYRGFLSL